MIPSEEINRARAVPILNLLNGVKLIKVSSARGGEYGGPCPLCNDGRDRFRVQVQAGRWFCRVCHPKWSSVIDFVMKRDGLSFADAVKVLLALPTSSRPAIQQTPQANDNARSAAFAAAARGIVDVCRRNLFWTRPGEAARAYLHGRGLTNETIEKYELGYSQGCYFGDKVFVPGPGIVLPWVVGGKVVKINVRSLRPDAQYKYRAVAGSVSKLFGLDFVTGDTVTLVEGEFDAMLLDQAGVPSAATGGSNYASIAPLLQDRVKTVLLLMDNDQAGQVHTKSLFAVLKDYGIIVQYATVPWGYKDIGDLARAGVLENFIQECLLGVKNV